MSDAPFPFIVADIGGTNGRFALVTGHLPDGGVKLEAERYFQSAMFGSFEDLFGAYVDTLDGLAPKAACLAIAGPIMGDQVRVTNLPWEFSLSGLQQQFGLKQLECMNDFAALAYSVLSLRKGERVLVKPGEDHPWKPRVILGAGTGLGVAGLVHAGNGWQPVPGEGGHITFGPSSALELEIRRVIAPNDEHISLERFISGPGMVNLHRALSKIRGHHYETVSPEDITRLAIEENDPLCNEVLQVMFELLGSAAGDCCLMYGALGGVYLAGGIIPRVESRFLESRFSECFMNKGRMAAMLERVPVYLMKSQHASFKGAAHWLLDREV